MTKRKRLKKKLDKIVREMVIKRDKSRCQKCGKFVTKQNCHVSHVIPRSHGDGLRWELRNLKVLCFHCHINWFHKNPVEAGEWFKRRFPDRWEFLEERKEKIIKFTDTDLEEMLGGFKKDNALLQR